VTRYHIYPHYRGGWTFRKESNKRSSIVGYKNEGRLHLIDRAMEVLLKRKEECLLVIHSKDVGIDMVITFSEGSV